MSDPQALVLPLGRVVYRLAVEVALVGGDADLTTMIDDDLAPRHEHLVEGQWCHVGASCGAQ